MASSQKDAFGTADIAADNEGGLIPPVIDKDREKMLRRTGGFTVIGRFPIKCFGRQGGIGMLQKKEVLLTEEGLAKVKEELEYLKTQKRQQVAQRLKEAITQGDLSENSEYDAAKEEQAFVESRIITLENMIRNAKIIDQNGDKNFVSVGAKVTIQELPDGEVETYTIVGSAESDPISQKISNESPIGSALIGKQEGETVSVPAPDGTIQFKILKIE